MGTPVVDTHCHTFNGDDLPMQGFIFHVGLHSIGAGDVLARLADTLVQGVAPGYAQEKPILDSLLAGDESRAGFLLATEGTVSAEPAAAAADLVAETDEAIRRLQRDAPQLLQRVGLAMRKAYSAPSGAAQQRLFGVDQLAEARRGVGWVLLYAKLRLRLTQLLIAAAEDRVDLLCPMLVDLDTGLGDHAPTTLAQQMELQEKISRLSMLGRLGSKRGVRVHPFIAFDRSARQDPLMT